MDHEDRILAFVQGRLSEADKTAFESDMKNNRAFAVEVEAMLALRREFEAADSPDTDRGWRDLERAISADSQAPANLNRPLRFSLWQTGGLIAASLVLWQFVAVPTFMTAPAPGYQTVTEGVEQPTLQVLFVEDANITAINALLAESNGTIVDGPSALGLYRVAFQSTASRDAALTALQEQSDVVDMVSVE